MGKKGVFLMILALVSALVLSGCDDGTTEDPGVDASLNGTWVKAAGTEEIKLNDGEFEARDSGASMAKGTYTANDGKLTMEVTHIHSAMFLSEAPALANAVGSKWYTKDELGALFKQLPGITDGKLKQSIDETFAEQTGTYVVNDDKLTLTIEGETTIFKRK